MTTRTGDEGYTGLLGSERLPKYDFRIEALGALDEANSALGLARSVSRDETTRSALLDAQQGLYLVMADIAATEEQRGLLPQKIDTGRVVSLEQLSEALKERVEIPGIFVVPGDTTAGAVLDLARTIVRRAERHVARLAHEGQLANKEVLRYLNRLSDLIFILARHEERDVSSHSRSGPLL